MLGSSLLACAAVGCLALSVLIAGPGSEPALRYPKTRKGDTKDTYFGTVIADPYRLNRSMATEVIALVAYRLMCGLSAPRPSMLCPT